MNDYWKKAKDCTPKEGELVLTYNQNLTVGFSLDRYYNGRFGRDRTFNSYPEFQVTHWTYLTEPLKEKEE